MHPEIRLDVSIVNVALPSIQTGLSAAQSELQWVVSGYALTFGLLLVPAGGVGDLRGGRTVFVAALGLFTLASAACGAAPNSAVLVVSTAVGRCSAVCSSRSSAAPTDGARCSS